MDIVLASGNPGKLRELQAILDGVAARILPQSELGVPAVHEAGSTFVENAIIKARHAAMHAGLPAIADDSGISVDALDGAPGVRSARYAGPAASDGENLEMLLGAMRSVPANGRTCRFVCVVAYMRRANDPLPLIATGVWEGRLLDAPRGTNGFGYDPVFLVPGHDCSAAELDPALKNRISHRARALGALRVALGACRT